MFWVDPLLLIGAGIIIAVIGKHWFYEGEREQLWTIGASLLVVFIFLFVSIGFFVNLPIVCNYNEPIFEFAEGEGATGTAFMINGGLFDAFPKDIEVMDLPPSWQWFCMFQFVLYPGFLWTGVVLGRVIFGRRPEHKGLMGIEEALDRENYSLEESPPFIAGKNIELEEES